MNLEGLAELIAKAAVSLTGVFLFVWMCIELPLWLAPFAFGLVFFLGMAFFGPIIAIASMGVAMILKLLGWLFSRRSRA